VFAILSDEPILAAGVLADLRAIGAAGPDAIRRNAALALPAGEQRSIVFEKVPAVQQ